MKTRRHHVIRKLISTVQVMSQDELRKKLVRHGFAVTQATLSRDIHELRLVKGPNGYFLPDANGDADEGEPSLNEVLSGFGLRVQQAQNQLVLRTTMGSAQPVAAALDRDQWDGVLGTIAGDDTVLIICADARQAAAVRDRLERLLA